MSLSSCATSSIHARTCGIHASSCKTRSLKKCQVTSWSYILQDTTVVNTADHTWHGATCKDSVPCSDPPGTAPRAEGLRCPVPTCHARGAFRCPLALCRTEGSFGCPLWLDARCRGILPMALCQQEQGPCSLGPSSGKFWDGGLDIFCSCASSAQRRRLHFTNVGSRLMSPGDRDP